jgi:hypothetical protein
MDGWVFVGRVVESEHDLDGEVVEYERVPCRRCADSPTPIAYAASTSEGAASGPDILSDWKIHENRKRQVTETTTTPAASSA